MEKFKAFATKRVAGVPVLVFVAIFMGGLLYYAIKMKPAEPIPVVTDAEAPEGDGDYFSGDTSQPVFAATPTIMQPSGPSVSATPMADTNELYGRRVTEWLIANGSSYTAVHGMVSKWLDGESLTAEEDKMRAKAVAHFGLPPESVAFAPVTSTTSDDTRGDNTGVVGPIRNPEPAPAPIDNIYTAPTPTTPPPVFAPAPAPTPPAVKQGAPPLVHVVRGNGDTSYRDLGVLYFNSTAFDLIQRMKAQDRNIGKDGPFPAGMHIKIPSANAHYFVATSGVRTASAIASKNGITVQQLNIMNPNSNFPVPVGTRVQVG